MTQDHQGFVQQAQRRLNDARRLLNAEISSYPTPISGCDAQFNHLLAERQKITRALDALSAEVFIPTPRTPTALAGVESR